MNSPRNVRGDLFSLMAIALLLGIPAAAVTDSPTTQGTGLGGNEEVESVDLGSWIEESYPPAHGFPPVQWVLAPDNLKVSQLRNGQPSFFYGDFDAIGTSIEVVIRVLQGAWDDDFIGFALGFQPGDTSNPSADYLLIDWKRKDQYYAWPQSCPPGAYLALRGLAVSRVTGVPTLDELWGHFNHSCSGAGNGVTELQRAWTLGSVGWSDLASHRFRFDFSEGLLRVFVDGFQEFEIPGSFSDGRLAFYNFSQEEVDYAALLDCSCSGAGPAEYDSESLILRVPCVVVDGSRRYEYVMRKIRGPDFDWHADGALTNFRLLSATEWPSCGTPSDP